MGGLIWAIIYVGQKRTADLQAVAQQLRLQFSPRGDDSIAPLLANLELFDYGQGKVSNLMRGQVTRNSQPITVAIFDYQYTIGADRDYTNVNYEQEAVSVSSHSNVECFSQTVLVFYDESINLPGFNLRPERLMDKMANLVGIEDINFRDFPVFSNRYRLDAVDVSAIRDLFQPNLIKFYESHKIRTEAIGSSMVILPLGHPTSQRTRQYGDVTFTESDLIQPSEVKSHLDLGLRLLNMMEKNLTEQHSAVRN